jgi:hypothetical protein
MAGARLGRRLLNPHPPNRRARPRRSEMGRVLKGRLVVHTASGQHVYDVKGRMPKYVPPDPATARSTLDTGRSSGCRGGGKAGSAQQPRQQEEGASAAVEGRGTGRTGGGRLGAPNHGRGAGGA